MSSPAYLIEDAWEKLLALPLDFWLVSPLVAFGFAFFGCVFWSLSSMFHNKKLLFIYFPILWLAFEVFGIAIETRSEVFIFIGGIIFGIYAMLVKVNDEVPPR